MRIDNFHFRPQLIPTLVLVLLLPLFLLLAAWQIDRAGQKRALAALLTEREALSPLQLDADRVDPQRLLHRSLQAEGRFVAKKSIWIENRKYLGRTGFHLLTPLRVEATGRYLLVNRGWLPASMADTPQQALTPTENVRVTGQVVIPSAPVIELAWQPPVNGLQSWPFVTLERYLAWSGLPLYPFILQQQDADPRFIRIWESLPTNDAMHIGYALQWSAFALIVLLLWLRLSVSRKEVQG